MTQSSFLVPSTGGRLLYTLSQLRGPIIPGVKLGSIILFSGFFIWPILSGPAVYTDHSLVGPDLYFGFYFTPSSTTSPTISSPSSPSSFDHQVSSPQRLGVTSLLHPLHQGGSPQGIYLSSKGTPTLTKAARPPMEGAIQGP